MHSARMMKKKPSARRNFRRRGFTLIEILITLAIVMILGGFLITNVEGIFGGAQEDAAKAFVKTGLDAALTTYKIKTGAYPTTAEGLQALMTPPGKAAQQIKHPLLTELPVDPWGNPYQYRCPPAKSNKGYDLYSLGPDGTESADDIGNWK